jgi:prolyl 4-hydroxylase
MTRFSYLRRIFLFISAFYVLQVILLLNLDPCDTENGPASLLPSGFCGNINIAKQHESESNAGVIQQHNTFTAASSRIESPVFVTDVGVRQKIYDIALLAAAKERVAQARKYLNNIVAVNSTYDKVRDSCKNRKDYCASYAAMGKCDFIPAMQFECAPVCQSCEQMDVDIRCKVHPAVDALNPFDLDRRYEQITTNPAFEQYGRKVVSRPSYAPGDTIETADYQLGPWIVVFDNALTDEEADTLVELGSNVGYTRSEALVTGLQTEQAASVDSQRTSTTAWCKSGCAQDPTVQRVMNRIATITGIGVANYENLQLLRYEKGQFYKLHNDYIAYHKNRMLGSRVLTFYVYLSDVDEGGGTMFPHLNLTITPKKGRAVLWPSVLNHDPNSLDNRTNHEAMEVIKGVKYGFNAWIHQRDYKTSHEWNCQ